MGITKKIIMERGNNPITLTVDIEDEKRQTLAYNMLYYMAENGATVTVDGKEQQMEKDQLYLLTADGDNIRYTKPHLDPEWYGANGHNFYKNTHLTVASMDDDYTLVRFAPVTGNYEKANEMFNFMHRGIDPSVSISYPQDNKMRSIVINGHPKTTEIADENGNVRAERYDYEWAKGKMPEIEYYFKGDKKYELLTDDTRRADYLNYDVYSEDSHSVEWSNLSIVVYRIRALRDFGDVKAGDLGGYIESENNLAHDGNCWVYDKSVACCDAVVKDNAALRGDSEIGMAASVSGNANIFGKARIKNNVQISDYAKVGTITDGIHDHQRNTVIIENNAKISGNAEVIGETVVSDNAVIKDNAKVTGTFITNAGPEDNWKFHYYTTNIRGDAVIEGDAQVTNAHVESNAHISENAVVSGHSTLGGHATIAGNAEINGSARIMHNVEINGNAKIGGTAEIIEKVKIGRDADIQEKEDFLSLKALGKTSMAFRNHDDGITIVHKGNAYNDIDDFKAALGSVDSKGITALNQLEDYFNDQMAKGFKEGIASIDMNKEALTQ